MADISTLPTLPTLPTDTTITTIDPTNDTTTEQDTSLETHDAPSSDDDFEFEELDEELIIEDFTIDGICGVY